MRDGTCTVPSCLTQSQGTYTGPGPYAGREVCPLHTAALHAKNPNRKK